MPDPVDLAAVLATFTEPWQPRTVATLNDYDIRVVKVRGEFTRHTHPDTVGSSATVNTGDNPGALTAERRVV
jgi:hypothetical protein